MFPYVGAKFRKFTFKKEILLLSVMLECNLRLFGRVLLFANASKSTRCRKSMHGTRLRGVALARLEGYPSSATVSGVCGLQ